MGNFNKPKSGNSKLGTETHCPKCNRLFNSN